MLGEVFFWQWNSDSHHDQFAVAIVKDGGVVGHVQKEISSIYFMLEQ